MGLELYAKIEPLIPFDNEIEKLYKIYLKELKKQNPASILDLGCGGGKFMQKAIKDGFLNIDGIDLSLKQIEIAKKAGLNAEAIDIKAVTKKYDAVVAVFDVLNYVYYDELESFLKSVQGILNDGGKFYADINTLHGFNEVAQGDLLLEGEGIYGSLSSYFEENKLETNLRIFTKSGELYKKEEDVITQYYHSIEYIKKINPFKNLKVDDISLYGKKADKFLLTFWD